VHAWLPTQASGVFTRADGPQTSAFQIENGRAVRWYAPSGVVAYDRVSPLRQTASLALGALLTAIASIAALVGLFTRDRREFRQTPMQARAGRVQAAAAVQQDQAALQSAKINLFLGVPVTNDELMPDAVQFLKLIKEKMALLKMDPSFMNRAVNEGFSGGEKKRNEIFQMAVCNPTLALMDDGAAVRPARVSSFSP